MSDLVISPDLRITVWNPSGCTMTTAAVVMAVPAEITAVFDGDAVLGAGGTQIRFSLSALSCGGTSLGNLDAIATALASHLTAHGDWPGGEAWVYRFPVVDFRIMWQVLPERAVLSDEARRAVAERDAALAHYLGPVMGPALRQMMADKGLPMAGALTP